MSSPARGARMLHVLAWLTGAGLVIAWIASGMSQRDALRGELVALRAHHALLAQATAQADSLPLIIADMQTKLQMLEQRLPDSADVDPEALTNTIREGLAALGLQIETLDLGERTAHEFYGQRSLNLSATGPSSAKFAAIAALLQAAPERQLQTLSLTHADPDATSVLRLQLHLHLYDKAAP